MSTKRKSRIRTGRRDLLRILAAKARRKARQVAQDQAAYDRTKYDKPVSEES